MAPESNDDLPTKILHHHTQNMSIIILKTGLGYEIRGHQSIDYINRN